LEKIVSEMVLVVAQSSRVQMHGCVSRISNVLLAPWDQQVWYYPSVVRETGARDWMSEPKKVCVYVCVQNRCATEAPAWKGKFTERWTMLEAPSCCWIRIRKWKSRNKL
jgi:hypothetical protein